VFYANLLQKLGVTPGIRAASMAKTVPVQDSGMRLTFDDLHLESDFNMITPGFFKTLNIPIIQGRDFESTDTENSVSVGIINQAMAKRFWPNQQPLGKVLKDVGGESKDVQIVGVVPDVKFRGLQKPADPMLYVPLSQWNMQSMTVLVSGDIAPQAALFQLQRVLEQMDRTLPLFEAETLNQKLEQSLIQERVLAGLLAIFGSVALLLAAVGLYSLLSFITETRIREIGIRMAIGAKRVDVLKTFLSRGIALTTAGMTAGVFLSLAASRVLESLLFAVTRFDAWTYAGIIVTMMMTSFAASYFPARRAANLDPVQALRYE
jgi:predicted permease